MIMKRKRLFPLLLTLAMVMTMSFAAIPAYATSGTAISTAEDFKAIENNPSGSYYLANDIELPAGTSLFADSRTPFTGTLDGNGHTIKNYTYRTTKEDLMQAALFGRTKNATFKNLTMTNVDISVKSGGNFAALAAYGQGSKFENITISGKIAVNGTISSAAGIVGALNNGGSIINCTNKADVIVSNTENANAAGVVGHANADTIIKNCSNSGNISISGPIQSGRSFNAAGITTFGGKTSSCKNSGDISVKTSGKRESVEGLSAAGIIGTANGQVSSCSNTGKITTNSTVEVIHNTFAGGIVANGESTKAQVVKSWNKGSVTFTGLAEYGAIVGGIGASTSNVSQCWNKGTVSAKATRSERDVLAGGLAGKAVDMRNSYNTASVTLNGSGYVGGLAGSAGVFDHRITGNYSTGTIKASKGATKGQLIGTYAAANDKASDKIYNNYYTKSGKAYGFGSTAKKSWAAKASKVSSVKAANCPKLSSKYWTYSSKYGRMILKNNKEK